MERSVRRVGEGGAIGNSAAGGFRTVGDTRPRLEAKNRMGRPGAI